MTAPESDDHFFQPDPEASPDPLASNPVGPPASDPERAAAAPADAPAAAEGLPVEPGRPAAAPSSGHRSANDSGGAAPEGPADDHRDGLGSGEGVAPAGTGSGEPVTAEPGAPARERAGEDPERAGVGRVAAEAERDERGEPDGGAGAGGLDLGAGGVWPPDEALEAVDLDDTGWTRRSLEAILLVADEPVPAATLAELVGARLTQVEALLIDLAGEYAGQGRGFVLRAVAGGWRLYTHPATREVVEEFLRAGQQSRLTRAALETLAVIAYRQPVTRHQVAAVRGVNVDGVFRTLATRGLIHEVGHEEGPGQAALYATTPAFLEQLGLNGLDQLPPIKDYLPEGVDLTELLEQM